MGLIVVDDIDNGIFVQYPVEVREKYVGYANEEVRDVAIRIGADPENIVEPLHFKVKRHAINVALNMFAQDYINVNSDRGGGTEDIYENLFTRTNWIIQKSRNSLSKIMFTGGVENQRSRAVESVRTYRG